MKNVYIWYNHPYMIILEIIKRFTTIKFSSANDIKKWISDIFHQLPFMATALIHDNSSQLLQFMQQDIYKLNLSQIASELMYEIQLTIRYLKVNDSMKSVMINLRDDNIDETVLYVCLKFFIAVSNDLLKLQLNTAVIHWRNVHKEFFEELIMPIIRCFDNVCKQLSVDTLHELVSVLNDILTKIEIVYKCDSLLGVMEKYNDRHIHVVLKQGHDKEFTHVFENIKNRSQLVHIFH
eukprot:102641_1